jgi:hypothetical protein
MMMEGGMSKPSVPAPAYDHVVWITSFGEFRQGHFANGGASGCRRSRYGRKDGAPSDVGVKQAARKRL